GMMREYIYRFHNPDKFTYLHPKMEELLKETYGVMVYQEDVIKVAHYFAGLDMAEADILRRAMSGKYRGSVGFDMIRDKFFANCKAKGYPDDITTEVWRQMESFSGYSFSKAHSASFAVESYQSLYLKTYYPTEFMVAVINNFGGFYPTELYFHELKRTGAKVQAPCINHSCELTSVRGSDVYVGFTHIKGIEKTSVETIISERSAHGLYTDLPSFMERTGLGIEQLTLLIRIGAFRFTGKSKRELMWEANLLQKKYYRQPSMNPLFKEPVREFRLPPMDSEPFEDALDEIELLGFPLSNVFDLVDAGNVHFVPAAHFHLHVGKVVDVLGYYITIKALHTIKGEYMFFGTFIDTAGDWIDTVHFPQAADQYPLTGKGFYHIRGKVAEEFGVYGIDVQWLQKCGLKCKE
ncbi:MAG: DNA polymerase III subunit alpha, partial [Bacteroidota bacterium]|nr:DNA polymerase III subunit alpha [Bacteroidota bacterium]